MRVSTTSQVLAAAVLLILSIDAHAQTQQSAAARRGPKGQPDVAAASGFPEVRDALDALAPVLDAVARDEALRSAVAVPHAVVVTSAARPKIDRLRSANHDRGAIDVVTSNMPEDALAISAEAGSDYVVIHERPLRPVAGAEGPSADMHTVYVNGKVASPTIKPPRATGEHIHIQPQFNERIHNIAYFNDLLEVPSRTLAEYAADISAYVETGRSVTHVLPVRPMPRGSGPSAEIHTDYEGGRPIRTYAQPPHASGERIQVGAPPSGQKDSSGKIREGDSGEDRRVCSSPPCAVR